jgi:carboxyl-terminal processing protease
LIGTNHSRIAAILLVAPMVRAETRYVAILEDIWSKINAHFYDAEFNGVNWKAARDRYRLRAERATNLDELYDSIDEMLAELRSSHVGFTRPSYPGKRKVAHDVGVSICEIGGEVVVCNVDGGSEAAKANVRAGSTVRSVDGEVARDRLRRVKELVRRRVSLATDRHLQVVLHRVFFYGDADSEADVVFEREDGQLVHVRLRRTSSPDVPRFSARRLASGYIYMRFSAWAPPVDKEIEEELRKVLESPGLILDLRGNAGGWDQPTARITSHFFPPNTFWGSLVSRNGQKKPYYTRQSALVYGGPLAVLVDEASGSASENFASLVQERGRGVLIGRVTCGCLTATRYDDVKGGGKLGYPHIIQISSKGRKIEGNGITPDQIVPLTISDLRSGRDAVLEQAERALQTMSRR